MTGSALAFAGVALAVLTTALWVRRVRQVRLPRNRSGFVLAWLGAATLGALGLNEGAGWVSGAAAVVSIFIGAFASFTISISRQEYASDAISPGDRLPPFGALDEFGEHFESDVLSGAPVLIKFFRGHW